MRQFHVDGMSCAACSARVEKAVSAVEDVRSCSVNLLTNSMTVEGDVPSSVVIAAVEKAGYAAVEIDASPKTETTILQKDQPSDTLLYRLISSLLVLLALMYVSMGHGMWGWPMPPFFEGNTVAVGLLQLLLSGVILVINQRFFVSGVRGVMHLAPNMDTLVALGSAASYLYSTVVLFTLTAAPHGDTHPHFYFESAAMILTLVTLGKWLESRSKGKTTDALRTLMDLSPKTATVIRDGRQVEIPVEQVVVGDCFVVFPGAQIPVDGVVLEGTAAVDESALTGESIPVDKAAGDTVSAATLNRSGHLVCKATRVGDDTTLAEIVRLVSDASASKAPIAKLADKVAGVFVPVVLLIAFATAIVWLLLGADIGFALARGVSVLVISCPCALGLATPVAIMVGSGVGAKRGILFKTATALESTGRIRTVVLDKTGTVTKGEPQVTAVLTAEGVTEAELLRAAVTLEAKSEHPLAKAVVAEGEKRAVLPDELDSFRTVTGRGLEGIASAGYLRGGNASYISESVVVPETLRLQAEDVAAKGQTPLYFSCDERCLGVIAVADVLKEDSTEAIAELKAMGLRVVMLTGDLEKTAKAIAATAGIDEVIAEVLPDGKEEAVRALGEHTMMVGDGINDAPALTRATVGAAIGTGTDVAMDAADVILMNSRLSDVTWAVKLGRAVLRTIRQNLFWAFIYNVIGIPLAAGIWIPLLGWEMDPMFGAMAMSISSVCVVSNALRLNRYLPRKNAVQSFIQEDITMKKTMTIEGMMCGHCSGRVQKVLEALSQVESAVVSHESGTAVVTLSAPIEDAVLKSTVEEQGYTVLGME
ncbi:MAG: heavy metal translocating P-type ATPase [Clostridia bacterium]|nr:heavy metal translocating P-type ATPase [Clostridia bacterium]